MRGAWIYHSGYSGRAITGSARFRLMGGQAKTLRARFRLIGCLTETARKVSASGWSSQNLARTFSASGLLGRTRTQGFGLLVVKPKPCARVFGFMAFCLKRRARFRPQGCEAKNARTCRHMGCEAKNARTFSVSRGAKPKTRAIFRLIGCE